MTPNCAEPDETHSVGVWNTMDHSQLTGVLVERDEDAAFTRGTRDDLVVARLLDPIARPDHVVTRPTDRRRRAAPDARVEKEPDVPRPVTTGSARSWPTRPRA